MLHCCHSIVSGHCDCRDYIRKQLGIPNGDSSANHCKPLLLSLIERVLGNGLPDFTRHYKNFKLPYLKMRSKDTIKVFAEAITRPGSLTNDTDIRPSSVKSKTLC